MYIYHALINALSAHLIHTNLNMIFCTHVEHSPTKTIYMKYYTENQTYTRTTHTHTHTHTHCTGTHAHTHLHTHTHTHTNTTHTHTHRVGGLNTAGPYKSLTAVCYVCRQPGPVRTCRSSLRKPPSVNALVTVGAKVLPYIVVQGQWGPCWRPLGSRWYWCAWQSLCMCSTPSLRNFLRTAFETVPNVRLIDDSLFFCPFKEDF